ncbi:hypothetical protein EIN_111520 [Entamoeba invadens IP1]|uniref:Uncharacterized protein n=1 Tax=Entamoeba invadens IP1 TaxID=370355 RepID=A0A0A1TXV6_ENTIV|nr:hypothetical protein EIN_111520 [Entamoeba invadens IP1]ELP86228.1 hypothetical protein EIN_111520 [Entamoeba invadens IP1]|eukprot:XP_004185574.1 hypothetical protein EIN_111520 [Entamoeba invadens IP1]
MSICSLSSTKSDKRNKTSKYTIQKKMVKDLECYQESILVYLINNFCSITIARPRKQSTVALCCAKVKILHFKNGEIDVMNLAESRLRPTYLKEIEDGIAKPTAFRRYEKNKKIFVHNFLFDIALELGFTFDSKLSRKSEKTFSIERFERIFFKGKEVFNLQQIVTEGGIITDHLFDLVANGNSVKLGRFDEFLQTTNSAHFFQTN